VRAAHAPRLRFFAIVQRFVFAVVRFVWCRACFVLPIYWLCCDNFLSVAVRFQPVLLPFVLFLCGVFQLVPLCATTVYAHPHSPVARLAIGSCPFVSTVVYWNGVVLCSTRRRRFSLHVPFRSCRAVCRCALLRLCSGAIFVNRSVVANRCHCPT